MGNRDELVFLEDILQCIDKITDIPKNKVENN